MSSEWRNSHILKLPAGRQSSVKTTTNNTFTTINTITIDSTTNWLAGRKIIEMFPRLKQKHSIMRSVFSQIITEQAHPIPAIMIKVADHSMTGNLWNYWDKKRRRIASEYEEWVNNASHESYKNEVCKKKIFPKATGNFPVDFLNRK